MSGSYYDEFDYVSEMRKELTELKEMVKTQQQALAAITPIIDELRKENELLKNGLYLRELTNELNKYKQLAIKNASDYVTLSDKYNELMSKYIKL